MKFTAITNENVSYFDSAIGGLFREDHLDRLYFGVLDEEDEAVGAISLDIDNDTLWIRFIGVTDEKRNMGYGTFLVEECGRFAAANGYRCLAAAFYDEERTLPSNDLAMFLLGCSFTLRPAPVERQVYLWEEFEKAKTVLTIDKKEEYRFCKGCELNSAERKALIELSLQEDGGISYVDTDLLFSKENRYGGVLFMDNVPAAAATIVPFSDGARVDQLYGRLEELSAIRKLLSICLEEASKEGKLQRMYIDVGGERLQAFQKQSFERAGVRAERIMQGYIAEKGVG